MSRRSWVGWSGWRRRRSSTATGRRRSRCCCGSVSWSRRIGGWRLGSPSSSGGWAGPRVTRRCRRRRIRPSTPPRPRHGRARVGSGAASPGTRAGPAVAAAGAVDEVVESLAARVPGVRARLRRRGAGRRGGAVRHQVDELPPIARAGERAPPARGCAARCAPREPRAELPAGVAAAAFGPRLQAAVAMLAVRNRVSRRDVVELREQLFGAELCTGSVDAILTASARRWQQPYAGLARRRSAAQPALNIDETGWRTAGAGARCGARSPTGPRCSGSRPTATQQHARALLGDSSTAIVCSDRWWAYDYLPPRHRQLCWAHLRSRLHRPRRGLAAEKAFGEAGLADRDAPVRRLGDLPAHTATAPELKRRSPRSSASSRRCSQHLAGKSADNQVPPPVRHATCSSSGRRSGPSPTPTASSRPTTTPNARSAAPSSTASSPSAANPTGERTIERLLSASHHLPPPTPLALTPTSSTPSPPTPAATPSPPSPDRRRGLNAYRFSCPGTLSSAPVAQWTERRTSNPRVGGSNPPGRIEVPANGDISAVDPRLERQGS